MLIAIQDIYQPIPVDIKINNKKAVSYFALATEVVFTVMSKARYQIPRITLPSDSVYVSIQDPSGVVRVYRELMAKDEKTFIYKYQLTDMLGAWLCSVYSILNDNHFITRTFIGFVLE